MCCTARTLHICMNCSPVLGTWPASFQFANTWASYLRAFFCFSYCLLLSFCTSPIISGFALIFPSHLSESFLFDSWVLLLRFSFLLLSFSKKVFTAYHLPLFFSLSSNPIFERILMEGLFLIFCFCCFLSLHSLFFLLIFSFVVFSFRFGIFSNVLCLIRSLR